MRKLTLPLLATLLLAGCASTPEAKPEAGQNLLGSWRLTEIAGHAIALPEARIQFDDENRAVSASLGCNRIFGRYQLQQDRLTLSPPATTLMACADPEISQLEQRLSRALQAVDGGSYRIENGALLLQTPDGMTVLKAQRQTNP
ncbi:MAG: META domain-containing protein [Pseudomonadota bacterium]|nr:META domain-containing protein [Pseudomonadota bacterium]